MKTALVLLPFLLAPIIAVQGESKKSVKSPEVIEKNKEHGKSVKKEKPAKKTKAQQDPESEINVYEEGANETRPGGKDKFELLKTEGQPGWMEKLLKKASKEIKEKENDMVGEKSTTESLSGDSHLDGAKPDDPIYKLQKAIGNVRGSDGASQALTGLKEQWNKIPFRDRLAVTMTLQVASRQIGNFANAGDDPIGAIQGAAIMVGQFGALLGPGGQAAAIALSFVSGFLSLFGKGGKEQKSIGQIVRDEIDEALAAFSEQTLTNQASGVVRAFTVSKAYADSLAGSGKKLTVNQAKSLQVNVPLFHGMPFMGTLASEIERLLNANEVDDAKKTLKYIELYVKMAVLKDMIMQEVASLLPEELEPNRQALLKSQERLRLQHRELIRFLRDGVVGMAALGYFDPDVYPITDSYLTSVLKLPDYDRSLAGSKWCLTPHIPCQKLLPISRHSYGVDEDEVRLKMDPYYVSRPSSKSSCIWKLIPHGNNLYTVKIGDGKYLSLDPKSEGKVVTTATADLWEIDGAHKKRIRYKWGSEQNEKWTNMQLEPEMGKISTSLFTSVGKVIFRLTSTDVGYVWSITKGVMNGYAGYKNEENEEDMEVE